MGISQVQRDMGLGKKGDQLREETIISTTICLFRLKKDTAKNGVTIKNALRAGEDLIETPHDPYKALLKSTARRGGKFLRNKSAGKRWIWSNVAHGKESTFAFDQAP